MAVTVEELEESRSGDGRRVDLIYVVKGTADDTTARDELLSTAPATHDGLPRSTQRPRVKPMYVDINDAANSIWKGTVSYLHPDYDRSRSATGDNVFSFDTTGGTEHITQSLGTIAAYARPGDSAAADDFEGAIGVALGQDRVEGTDIISPTYRWTERVYLGNSIVTAAYRANVYSLTGKVNEYSFRGFDKGEVLFIGARGSQRGSEDWEVTFEFAARPNRTGLEVGNITGIEKEGWQYVWFLYKQRDTGDDRFLRPIKAYVEKVYRYGDFSDLEIGVT